MCSTRPAYHIIRSWPGPLSRGWQNPVAIFLSSLYSLEVNVAASGLWHRHLVIHPLLSFASQDGQGRQKRQQKRRQRQNDKTAKRQNGVSIIPICTNLVNSHDSAPVTCHQQVETLTGRASLLADRPHLLPLQLLLHHPDQPPLRSEIVNGMRVRTRRTGIDNARKWTQTPGLK